MTAPIPFQWDGEVMVPARGFAKICDQEFVVGQVYRLVEEQERPAASHRHFFAACNEAWANLPESMAARFPTPDALRKFALIRTGFADSRSIVVSSKAEALRLAAFVQPRDEFAIVTTEGATITVWTAKTQSMRAMNKQEFAASKEAVLNYLAELIGTSADALKSHAASA